MTHEKIARLRASARQVLEDNILRFWAEQMYDPEGGFYGRMDGQNVLHPEAERGAVLNARLLWSFAAAYRVLRKPDYLRLATHAKEYICARFLDKEQGGCYWSVSADGQPLDTKKQTYAIGFMIYGFSEYHRATGDQQALDIAVRLFHDIEAHTFDAVHIGYIEALTRDWQPIADMRLSDKDENAAFTMNTHLHILESYTNLYRVWRDPRLAERLRLLIRIFTNKLYNPDNHHVDCFFDTHWHGKRNIASYGHDIEAAWLLNEALDVLGDERLTAQVRPVTARIAEASVEGLQPDGSMEHENHDASRQWWVECEAVIGFVDQWERLEVRGERLAFSGDAGHYWQLAERVFAYICDHLIDREHGEWYWAILPDGTTDTVNDKAGFWKCPYHNSRMCLEMIERFEDLKIVSETV